MRSLADLAALRDALRERERAERSARTSADAARARRERDLFRVAVGEVTRVIENERADVKAALPAPTPRQRERDERAALDEAMSDAIDIESLLHSDEALSFRHADVGADVLNKLRRGVWSIQAQLDLHRLTRDGARSALAEFLRDARRRGLRCVRIVHGKGHGSPGRTPVLKAHVRRWLAQRAEVAAFVQARPADGGAGALVVLLRASDREPSP